MGRLRRIQGEGGEDQEREGHRSPQQAEEPGQAQAQGAGKARRAAEFWCKESGTDVGPGVWAASPQCQGLGLTVGTPATLPAFLHASPASCGQQDVAFRSRL